MLEMEKPKINKLIIVFLIGVFIGVCFSSHLWARQDIDAVMQESGSPEEPISASSEPAVDLRVDVKYTAEGLRDPFESYLIKEKAAGIKEEGAAVEQVLPSLVVQGIIWGGSFPQAIINDKVVKIGDEVEGARILEISKEGVVVFYDNRRYDLSSPAAAGLENLKKKSEGGKYEGPYQSP